MTSLATHGGLAPLEGVRQPGGYLLVFQPPTSGPMGAPMGPMAYGCRSQGLETTRRLMYVHDPRIYKLYQNVLRGQSWALIAVDGVIGQKMKECVDRVMGRGTSTRGPPQKSLGFKRRGHESAFGFGHTRLAASPQSSLASEASAPPAHAADASTASGDEARTQTNLRTTNQGPLPKRVRRETTRCEN